MSGSWEEFQARRGVGKAGGSSEVLETFIEEFPLLGQFMGKYLLPDGRLATKCGSVTFFFEGGRFKVCLNDHYASLKGFLTLSEAHQLLTEIELALQGGGVEWKPEKRRS